MVACCFVFSLSSLLALSSPHNSAIECFANEHESWAYIYISKSLSPSRSLPPRTKEHMESAKREDCVIYLNEEMMMMMRYIQPSTFAVSGRRCCWSSEVLRQSVAAALQADDRRCLFSSLTNSLDAMALTTLTCSSARHRRDMPEACSLDPIDEIRANSCRYSEFPATN